MAKKYDDFREVAHSGGKITFSIVTDENGARGYSVEYSGSSPTPMSLVAIYALPQGIPCGDIQLGGIGQPWNPPPFPHCIPVFIGSDSEGNFGHQCPQCERYWRSSGAPSRWPITCAYCGLRAPTWQFLTPAQRHYVEHYAQTLAEAIESEEETLEVVIDMDAASDAATIPKPSFYYGGQTQQTTFHCEACGAFNDIRGQYGYCGMCGTRNNFQVLKSEVSSIRDRMNLAELAPEDALKSAISNFDSCCRNYVAQLVANVPLTSARRNRLSTLLFHNIEVVAKEVKSVFDIGLFDGLANTDIAFLKLMFHRRHAFEHDGGQATARYLAESGDTTVAEGDLIRETRENVHTLIGRLHRMAGNIDRGFHELFPPEEKPVAYERERQARMKGSTP